MFSYVGTARWTRWYPGLCCDHLEMLVLRGGEGEKAAATTRRLPRQLHQRARRSSSTATSTTRLLTLPRSTIPAIARQHHFLSTLTTHTT